MIPDHPIELLILLCFIEALAIILSVVLLSFVWPRKSKPLVVSARDANGRRIRERL